jgi:hypothetical protein
MSDRLAISVAVIAVLAAARAHPATCPVSECDYLDPQFKVAFQGYMNCTSGLVDQFIHAMDQEAILFPRFGIAWHAQQAEVETAQQLAPDAANTAIEEAHRRFEDRILRTAEPDALEFYNLMEVKLKQQTGRCGPMPEPPQRKPGDPLRTP